MEYSLSNNNLGYRVTLLDGSIQCIVDQINNNNIVFVDANATVSTDEICGFTGMLIGGYPITVA